ncbi:polysaccharide deacetylase [Hoeflea sp. YIM 152468]|uniref:polysaccharide deacetylase n=1 Tax=Hoeflea sp. YIM 152468 TaxID=3031759 RepID=UPI0023DC9EB2|nr:polysaccharide deacetylase [Hoeflea sp. YIM 152468]MDF1606638.1 polysaccharide deacetylase [Hoeflea sp. YIM 152468]
MMNRSALFGRTTPSLLCAAVLLTPATGLAASPAATATDGAEQLVVISFDGAHDNALWQRSLDLAERSGARLTYFLSCTFLMTRADRKNYTAPGHSPGRSNVGFALNQADVQTRLGHIWSAYQAGHEIASHGCGHFDGKAWSKSQWLSEFAQFDAALADAWRNNGAVQPPGWSRFARSGIKGFRAPYLSTGDGLYAALAEHGLAYDASGVSNGVAMPDTSRPTARFALPLIPEGPRDRPLIAMDYNLFVRHSAGIETPSHAKQFEARTMDAFRAAFEAEYTGKRRPLQLGFHFVEMNGGAYWNALERFALETCGRPGVACVTYQDALRRLNNAGDSAS